MKSINLKWAKDEYNDKFNFGDDLSPYIINKLSGADVRYFRFASSRINTLKDFVNKIIHGKTTLAVFTEFIRCFFAKNYIISIGSILQWYGSSRCIVWGSGIINKTDHINRSRFLAVRGEYTRARLKELGYDAPEVIGDPALLTPLIYTPRSIKKFKLGIIPHITHYEIIKRKFSSDDLKIIKLDGSDLEAIIEDIAACEYTISTSLHGLIISHAYNIKSLWFEYKAKPLPGNNVKFLDYFSSVKIKEYKPFVFDINKKIDPQEIISQILANDDINHSNIDISSLQLRLLEVAPFPVKGNLRHPELS